MSSASTRSAFCLILWLTGTTALAQDTLPYVSARPFGTLRQQAAIQQAWLKERLDVNLPQVMRTHGIDMWVVRSEERRVGKECRL